VVTIKTFLKRLRELNKEHNRKWHIEGKTLTSDDDLCPIHEVCLDQTGEFQDVSTDGRTLGLSAEDTRLIMQAADGIRGHDAAIRSALLEACGLKGGNNG